MHPPDLIDESLVGFVDVEAEEAESPSCAAANGVEELQRSADQIEVAAVVLIAQVVLKVPAQPINFQCIN